MKHVILLLCVVVLSGCVTPSENGAPYDPAFAITPSDLNQADLVEKVVARTPDIAGKYRVKPGSRSITVTFTISLSKEQEETVQENMRKISEDLTRKFGKANKLIFRFKNVELQQ